MSQICEAFVSEIEERRMIVTSCRSGIFRIEGGGGKIAHWGRSNVFFFLLQSTSEKFMLGGVLLTGGFHVAGV